MSKLIAPIRAIFCLSCNKTTLHVVRKVDGRLSVTCSKCGVRQNFE